jgi:thioredoxin 2
MKTDEMNRQIRCAACGAVNRISAARQQQGLAPVCGKCKKHLVISTRPVIVTDANFSEEVARSPSPVLLDMWAAWCGPCRILEPAINELAVELAGRIRVGKLNIDENQRTAGRFNVRSIPTLLVFNHGREVDRLIGLQSKREILQRLERLFSR